MFCMDFFRVISFAYQPPFSDSLMRLAPSASQTLSYGPFTAQYPCHFFEISASAWAGHYLLLMTFDDY